MSEIKSLIDDDIKENIDHSAICVKFAMMSKQIENKDKEIERLNNNWNKLEKYLIEEISRLENVEQTPTIILITGKVRDILDELRNLKGDESDENII